MTARAHEDGAPIAILFDVDGCLISTGGAGTKAWRYAFDRLQGIQADIGEFTEGGTTDPTVGRLTFTRVIGREPTDREMARLLAAYLDRLGVEVEQSPGYRVMPGVASLLPRLTDAGVLLGIVSGAPRTRPKRGWRDRSFTSWRRSSVSGRTRRTAASSSTRRCLPGYPT